MRYLLLITHFPGQIAIEVVSDRAPDIKASCDLKANAENHSLRSILETNLE